MDDDKNIIEINNDEIENTIDKSDANIKVNNSKSLKKWWDNLEKKTKILIICSLVGVLLLITCLILYFTIFKQDETLGNNKNNNEVIVANDNYRYENGNLVFLDKRGEVLGNYECLNKDPLLCTVAKSDFSNDNFERIISVNENGEELFLNTNIYFDNYVFIKDGEELFLYNINQKNKMLNLTNIKVYDVSSNLVVVSDQNNRYGLIELSNTGYNYLIRCSYDNLGIINNKYNYLLAYDKDITYLIDKDGKKITSNLNSLIKSANSNYFVGVENKKYNLYTFKNDEVLSGYDYIALYDDIIALVKDNQLFLRDYDLNKINEEGINLTNSNYVKKYIYDSFNKLKEVKVAFEISLNDNNITVNVDNEKININLLDSKVSNNYTYMNYYDGILYFYEDSEKENLIGTYTCLTKNVLTNENSTLDKCGLYNEDAGITGIYNNRYVFINDNKYIYLYDIKNSKNLGTYNEINILNKSEINRNMKLIFTNSSYILAKSAIGNNKNNYGILEITNDNAHGKVEFKYESINKKNDYYLMINIDKTYTIYDHDLKKISNEFAYIELFDNYYVGINDNKLNVYKYDNPLAILKEGLQVKDNKFTFQRVN